MTTIYIYANLIKSFDFKFIWFVSDWDMSDIPSPSGGQLCDAPVDIQHALEPSCLEVGW